ncbi:MAG: response regulator transcription factor [Bdellovibrionaceae bacterium]|nr:response regulator transcription factor [Pseudobdellovibrionaceae bacterium]
MSQKILVVEDEVDVRELVVLHLKRLGHAVTAVGSVEEARGAMAAARFDLAIVDWMLPGASGVDFIRETRRSRDRGELAILMLTAMSEPKDIVEGLDAGADDYLSKPFDAGVLVARVRALSRRISGTQDTAAPSMEVVKLGQLHLYPETYEVKCCGEPISLTPSEFKLLIALSKSQGRVLTRDSLISQIQGEGVSVVGRTVDTHVFGLRKKLGDCADVIETVRGVGYRVKPDLEA